MPVVVQRQVHSQVVDIPVVAQRQFPLVLTVQKTIVILQLQFIVKVSMPLLCRYIDSSGTVCDKTVEIPRLQLVEFYGQGR